MNLEKLNPWNWFKHEESGAHKPASVPVSRTDSGGQLADIQRQHQHPIFRLHQDIDRMFDEALRGFGLPSLFSRAADSMAFHPTLNVSSNARNYQVSLEVPGMSQGDLNIEVHGDALVIQGEKKEEHRDEQDLVYRVERRYGAFRRVLALPEDANAEEISAQMKDGVLKLSIPRRAAPTRDVRQIPISS